MLTVCIQAIDGTGTFTPLDSQPCRLLSLAKPDTILAWYRQLVAEKFDGCKKRRSPGRPRTDPEIEDLVVRLARENSGWGYDRIVGALANLGHPVSDQTVGNILRRHGIGPVPERSKTRPLKSGGWALNLLIVQAGAGLNPF